MGSGRGRTGADKGEDVFLRQERERVLIRAAEDSLAHPVSSALRGRLQDEVSEYPGAHVVRGSAGWGLPTDGPEKEPGAARVGIVPGGVRLPAEHVVVVRKRLEWGRRLLVLLRSAAGHDGWSLSLIVKALDLLEITYIFCCVLEETGIFLGG